MNMDSFFDKVNNVMRTGQKILSKVSKYSQKYFKDQLRTKTRDELNAMAQKVASEGCSPETEALLYEEMHRRGMV